MSAARKKEAVGQDGFYYIAIRQSLSIKAGAEVHAVLQDFAKTLLIHIAIQRTTWHNIGGLFRIGDTDYRVSHSATI